MALKKYLLIGLLLLVSAALFAQADPASWKHEVKATSTENVYEVVFTATITAPWHMYDLGPYEGGPNPTEFEFHAAPGVELIGSVREKVKAKRIMDEIFGMEIGYYSDQAEFIQQVKVTAPAPVKWEATVSYQLCDDQSCLAPTDWDFVIELPAAKTAPAAAPASETAPPPSAPEADTEAEEPEVAETPSPPAPVAAEPEIEIPAIEEPETESASGVSLWAIILEAIAWGLAAFLTPCVFPMAPMTVSFFMKGSENKVKARFNTSLYGFFIILLYTLPIAVIIMATYFIGGENVTTSIFNWIATHWLPNILFFIVFMLFAASFFGAFEIRMPTKLVNKADSNADKGGIFGVFFMALTLVLVSFSCTGPIVSSVLLKSIQGEIWEPIVTMLTFSIAFALPFTLLAFFPSVLKNLPKSGGWLNSVKVVLGFVEIVLGLKFLSIADQTYHWGLLDREVYLAIWIVVFTLLGLYLLGKIKFKHDSEVKYVGIFRLSLVIAIFSFVIYLIPGMWGAPLKALSGYLPPMHTQDFILGGGHSSGGYTASPGTGEQPAQVKYGDFLPLPHGLNGFFDYEEGMAFAKRVGKPVFVDVTGHGCVNCREMEARVWSDPQVLSLLRNEYVIIALYVDDKTRLPESQWVTNSRGKVMKGLGQINADFAMRRFGTSAQPYYALLDNEGRELTASRAYDLDIQAFVDFLQRGIDNYKQ
ncbi:MAG: thioredoxin family protein [Rikenellaceae bacterium]|nr:thioredoxin family protein [Rikenellaceae bacterium]